MDSGLAEVITAVAAVLTALALVITAIRTSRKVDAVHVLVNQQHTDLIKYQDDLVKALQSANVKVPEDQSIGAPVQPVVTPGHRPD